MRLIALAILAIASLAQVDHPEAPGKLTPPVDPTMRFAVVDVWVDSGNAPLAAYQLELVDSSGSARIVGVEGGEPSGGAFRAAPYFDPKAIQRDRVILAAFSTASNGALPKGKTRVATVHVRLTGEPRWQTKLVTAADASGETIAAEVSIESGN
jgi:hypothetical protein